MQEIRINVSLQVHIVIKGETRIGVSKDNKPASAFSCVEEG